MRKIIFSCLIFSCLIFSFVFYNSIISYGQIRNIISKGIFKENVKVNSADPYFGWTSGEIYTRTIAYNNNGAILASAGNDDDNYFEVNNPLIKLWDPNTGSLIKTLAGHKRWIGKIIFSNDGKYIASNDIDLFVKLWDVNKGELLRELSLGSGNNFNPFAFSPDGKFLAYAFKNQLNFYDIVGDSLFKTIFFDNSFWTTAISFSFDRKTMAIAGFTGSNCSLEIFKFDNWFSLWKWTTLSLGMIETINFSPDGTLVACSGPGPTIYFFSTDAGNLLNNITVEPASSFCFSTDSKSIAFTKSKGRGGIQFYDVGTGNLKKSIVFDSVYPLCLSFNFDGKKIAAGSIGDKNIRIYDLSSTNDVKTIESPKEFCLSQNYPNPFNPSTVINYQLPINSFVTLKIYDILGKEIATLVNEKQTPGMHNITWEPKNVPAGMYFYRLQTEKYSEVRKMVLIR